MGNVRYSKFSESSEFLRPFPAAEEVFAEPVLTYAEHILPLVSVDMSLIEPEWSGWFHFVLPIEPYDGHLGQNTHQYHNYYLRENWIGFRGEDGRYKLLGDFRYFFLENPPDDGRVSELYQGQRRLLEKHYRRARIRYEKQHQQYLDYGHIYHQFAKKDVNGRYKDEDRRPFIAELGGQPWFGNWSYGFPLIEKPAVTEDCLEYRLAIPLTEDGRQFQYVGCIEAFYYIDTDCDVLLFYDPQERIVLFTFHYT